MIFVSIDPKESVENLNLLCHKRKDGNDFKIKKTDIRAIVVKIFENMSVCQMRNFRNYPGFWIVSWVIQDGLGTGENFFSLSLQT